MKTLMIMCLSAWCFGQVHYDQLAEKLAAGESRAEIQQILNEQGPGFEVNLGALRAMKDDGFPDWLIDAVVTWDQEEVGDTVAYHCPQRYPGPPGYYGYPMYASAYDWLYWNWRAWPMYGLVWNRWFMGYPWFGHWDYPWSWGAYWGGYGYWGDGWYPAYGGSAVPGNSVSPRGYRNDQEDRVRGNARPRGSSGGRTKITSGGSARSGSSVGAVRSSGSSGGSSSRSSSSSGTARRK